MDANMLRHDGLVDKVKQELINRDITHLFDHVEYTRHQHSGEIDVYAQKDDYILLFEIKGKDNCHNYTKAVKQMTRAQNYFFGKGHRIFKFYVTYDKNNNVKYKWVKNYGKR